MQLIYLYIDKYKNIEKQGFNFSPEFACSFDGESLTVEKKESRKSIFPHSINLTAIVGKNGSGKSSLFEVILKIVENELSDKYILVYYDNGLKHISNFKFQTNIQSSSDFREKQNIFAYCNVAHKHYAFRRYNIIEIDKVSIANILAVEQGKNETSFKISSFMFLPTKIEIKLRDPEEMIEKSINFFKPQKREQVKNIFVSIEDQYHQYLFISYGREKGINASVNILNNKELLKEQATNIVSEKDFDRFFLSLVGGKTYDIAHLSEEQKNIYIRKNGYHYFFNFDMIDEKQRRFNDLSHGEQMLFGQLLNLYFFSDTSTDSLIFLFDEPEIALHPNWQRKYLNEVITLLRRLEKKYQFVLTSHSPFILSDIPKQNIIFIKDGKNVSDEVDIDTFGANIHTLLSHGFFMEDGLMGEYAKSKINEVIKLLNHQVQLSDDEIEKCENIIAIVGEPILKRQLQKMLDSKRLKKMNEIDIIKQNIELLQKRLKKIEDAED
jgi:predicted ATP-dependent endonuclease of OLD family/polyhydroxyalkanoate synthesis regulator phasin